MKWWKSAFNAQGSRLIIVDLQEGVVKIYAAIVGGALMKKEGQDETHHFTTKVEVPHPWMLIFFKFLSWF